MMAALAVMTAALAIPGRSQADEGDATLAIMPVFSQLVAWRLPPGFHRANEEVQARTYAFQATPEGDTLDHWSQLIALTGAAGRASDTKMTPKAFASGMAAGFKQDCPDSYHGIELQAPAVDGYESFAAVISCGEEADGSSPAHSKTDLLVVVKGAHDYYTFQWAERGPAQRSPMQIDAGLWSRRLAGLMPIRLCERIPGEQPPYPSCVSRITNLAGAGTEGAGQADDGPDSSIFVKRWEAAGFVITMQHYVATLSSACAPILGDKRGESLLEQWRNQAPNGLFLDISLAYQEAFIAAVEKSSGKQAAQAVLARQMDLARQMGDDEARKLLAGNTAAKADTCRRFADDVAAGAYTIVQRVPYYDTLKEWSHHVTVVDATHGGAP